MAKKITKKNAFNIEEILQELVQKLLKLAQVEAKAFIEATKSDSETIYTVKIDTENAGLLIGGRGETINAIQSFLAMALKQKTGEWARVVVDIGDWREKQEEYLKNLAQQAVEKARGTGEPQPIYNLTSAQRRIIHLEISKEEDLATESIGEGFERYMVVKVK